MQFRIADTFTDSLTRLTGDEQKLAKTTAFDLQIDPTSPGLQFHKLDRAKDKSFWSVRVGRDIRLIVHRTANSILLCYVDHHDKAYGWAERRKLEVHPSTGAAQFVEIRERVERITIPQYVEAPRPAAGKPPLFVGISKADLLSYGVPKEWLCDVQKATEDSMLDLAGHLPKEAAEALLELATGGKPKPAVVAAPELGPFEHPDAQRRFRLMTDVEELKAALESPWDKWTIFLHPSQREWVEKEFAGPARVSGSAGTGKTVVALHRAAFLARKNIGARVLLTTFSDALASALHSGLRRLISNEPRLGERIDVLSMRAVGERLYGLHAGKLKRASNQEVREAIREASSVGTGKFSESFLASEWVEIVDAWQLKSWDEYRTVARLGRKTRLSEGQREVLWKVFESVNQRLDASGATTSARMCADVARKLGELKQPPYDFIVVDESQDISVAQLRLLSAMGAADPNRLFFSGDLGQRIFQTPFSWLSLGVDIRGRSRTLRVNYRTSHQIRTQADRLLAPRMADVDGNPEDRRGTVSVFNGRPPRIETFANEPAEVAAVAAWIADQRDTGTAPHEIGIIVRSQAELPRAVLAADKAGLPYVMLDEATQPKTGAASVLTMHLAKGLEFKAAVVMACDDDISPLQSRIESVTDDSDLEEVYNTERHLLYVACTRARDSLMVSSVSPASEFLDDLKGK